MRISTVSFNGSFRKIVVLALIIALFALPFAAFADGDALASATISIPSLNLSSSVVNIPLDANIGTWNTNSLGSSVGHFEYTPWLGDNGNIVLGGHSTNNDGSPSIFYGLDAINVGDTITLSQGATAQDYVVTGKRFVAISDVSVLYPANSNTVTLITCAGYNDETGTYDQRLVVTARRAG